MPEGYCTVEDVRRALREADLPGDADQDRGIVVDAIVAQTEWLEKATRRHWYVADGIADDTDGLIPTAVKTRDDEHDIPTHAGFVHGASEHDHRAHRANSDALLEAGPHRQHHRHRHREPKREIRLAFGDSHAMHWPQDTSVPAYTRIRLERRDVDAVNELHVVNASGGFDDWVADSAFSGGVGNSFRGDDFWVRLNNEDYQGGWADLYLNVHSMDDDIPSFSNAVYVDLDFGHSGLPRTVRRGVAFRAGAELTEDAVIDIPQQATVYNVETKAEAMRERSRELLAPYVVEEWADGDA